MLHDLVTPSVLLLEDDFIHGGLIKSTLGAAGVHACMAVTEAEAADIIRVFLPDVIISDWDPAGIDGRAFVKSLRARGEALARVPAILMTHVHVSVAVRRELLEDGFRWMLHKPFSLPRLAPLVRHVFADCCSVKR